VLRDSAAALVDPEHTGENRCLPCTLVNAVGVAVVAGLLSRRRRSLGLLASVLGGAAIWLRGYVVPGTPRFARGSSLRSRSTSVSITGRGSIPGRSPTTRSRSKQMKTTRGRSKRLETTRGRSKQRRTTRRRTSRTPLPNATPTPNAPPTPIRARRRHRAERWSRGRGGRWRRRRRRPEDAHGDAYRRGCPRRRR